MVDITVRPETGVESGGFFWASPKAQELGAAYLGTRMPGETLTPDLAETFEATAAAFAVGEQNGDSAFRSYPSRDPDHPEMDVAFEWFAPADRQTDEFGMAKVASIFLSEPTVYGRDVMAYTLYETPAGPAMMGRAGKYMSAYGVLPAEAVASDYAYRDEVAFSSVYGAPISNDELGDAVAYAALSAGLAEPAAGDVAVGAISAGSDIGLGGAAEAGTI